MSYCLSFYDMVCLSDCNVPVPWDARIDVLFEVETPGIRGTLY